MFTSLFRAEDRSPTSDFWFQPVGNRSSTGARVNADTAMRQTAVYACVRVICESMAVLPFVLHKRRADGRGRDRVTDHWLYRLIALRPNRYQNPFAWREMVQGHLALRGNAFNRIIDGPRGEIAELMPMHPDHVKIDLLDNGSHRYRHTDRNGTETVLRRDQVWHLKGLSDDGLVGLNPIELNREAIGGAISSQQYANRFFANDAKPTSGYIEFPGKFADKEARGKFRDQLQEAQSGGNRGKMMVLDQGMKYHQISMNNRDAQFIEARQASVIDIARMFRMPPHKIGELSRSTNNNIEHQGLEFWTDAMLPWTQRWCSAIVYDLLGETAEIERLEPDFEFRALMRGDAKSRGEYLRAMVLAGIFTRNEGREEEGKNPLPGLDEPLVPANVFEGEGAKADERVDPAAPVQTSAPDDGDKPDDSSQARTHASRGLVLAQAAAQRVARKEMATIAQAFRAEAGAEQLAQIYADHARFVAAALGVSAEQAEAYCIGQADRVTGSMLQADYEATATSRLERLALTGVYEA